jgi:hypothetical protein
MSIDRISVDTAALPALLLPNIKAHCRVEHARDDAILLVYIGAAIGIAERKCNVSLNPAEYLVTADELGRPCTHAALGPRWTWPLPLNNVHAFTVVQNGDPGAPDITADFELWSPDFGGSASAYLAPLSGKAMPSTALLTLGVGVDDETLLAPEFFSLIARLTASQYENREASSDLWTDTFREELAGLWRPCA